MSESEMPPMDPNVRQSIHGAGQPREGGEGFAELGEKDVEEIATLLRGAFSGENKAEKKKEKEKTEESKGGSGAKANISKAEESTFMQNVSDAVDSHLKKPGPPGEPKLPVGQQDPRGVPNDRTGTANPWLTGSLAGELFLAFFALAPVLMSIKLNEVEMQMEAMIMQMENALDSADRAYESKKLEAEKLMIDAVVKFTTAAVSIAMVAAMAAKEGARGLKNAGQASQSQKGLEGTGQKSGLENKQDTMADQRAGAATEAQTGKQAGTGKPTDAGKSTEPGKPPKTPAQEQADHMKNQRTLQHEATRAQQKMQLEHQAFNALNTAMTSVVQGVGDMLKAEKTLQQGKAEMLKEVFSSLAQLMGQAVQFSQREIEQANKNLSGLVEALNKFIQAQSAFSFGKR